MIKLRKDFIQSLCLAYMIAWGIAPPLQTGNIFRALLVVCFFVWTVFAIKKCGKVLLEFYLKLFAFLFVMIGIAWIADGFQLGVVVNLQTLIFFCFLPVFFYYHHTKESPIWIFLMILIMLAVFNTTTLYSYSTIRNISRMMSKSFDGIELYLRRGIGGYGYIYSVVIALPIVLGVTIRHFKRMKWITRIIALFVLVTSIFIIVQAGYALAIIISIVSVALLLIYRKNTKSVIPVILLVIASTFLVLYLEDILSSLLPLVKGTEYESKVRDIILSLSSNESVGTVGGRMERYTRSIKLFFQSPIWGQLSRTDVGKHSAILDKFAQFGFLIGGIFTYYITYAQRILHKETFDKGISISVLVSTVMLSTLNNVGYSMGVILFVFYPVVANIINRLENKNGLEPPGGNS